jgi:predicted ABC-type ATPase
MEQARLRGFRVRLIYVCLSHPEHNVNRVWERKSQGGHDVPESDVVRRYERSLANLPTALKIAHEAVAYDNSGAAHRKVLETRNGKIVWRSSNLPAWANIQLD